MESVPMPNKRERILLIIFLSALGLALGTLGWTSFSRILKEQKVTLERKHEKLRSLTRWIDHKDAWKAKGEWIEAHKPPAYAGPKTEAAFVQTVQGMLGNRQIEILEQRMRETHPRGKFLEMQIDLVLSASLENLVSWLHETQQIDAFRAVIHAKLKSDADTSKIRAEISLVQFYAKPHR
jgi:hypothetical protein